MTALPLSQAADYKRITVIAVISLLLHGIGLLYLWQQPLFLIQEHASTTIAIQLSSTQSTTAKADAAQPETTDKQTPFPPSQQLSKTTNTPIPVPAPAPQTKLASQPLETAATTTNPPKSSLNTGLEQPQNDNLTNNASPAAAMMEKITVKTFPIPLKSQQDALRLELNKQIQRNYPLIARKRGWQGKVQLGFRVTSVGDIEDIHVTHSSGYAVLDNSAIKSLDQIKRLALAASLLLEDIELDLTIDYRLQDI